MSDSISPIDLTGVTVQGARATPPALDADVVVVGAGYGGMVAAYRLWRQGYRVKVVEAMDRVGGRTLTAWLSDGMQVDVVAGWTGSTEHHVLGLLDELGIEKYTQYGLGKHEGKNLFVAMDGELRRYDALDFPVSDDAQVELMATIAAIDTYAELVPREAPWTAECAEEWDRISAGAWLRANVKNEEARRVAWGNITSICALSPDAVSFLHLLWDSHCAGGIEKFGVGDEGSVQFRIRGGTQAIPLAIQALMGDDAFVLDSPVSALRQDADGVTVVSDRATLRCSRVIVAIPTCMSGYIRYQPPLPPDRAQLIQRTPQGSAMKVHLVYDRAWWRDLGLSGNSFAINDSDVPQTLDAGGPRGQDEPGILACFLDDDGSRDLARLLREERQQRIIEALVPRFGDPVRGLSTRITPNYVESNAAELEWVRGDYASTPGPRVLTASGFGPALRDPVGRIHWAGVDTATIWYQSIEGAAQSGVRAAKEVIAAGLPAPGAVRGTVAGGAGVGAS